MRRSCPTPATTTSGERARRRSLSVSQTFGILARAWKLMHGLRSDRVDEQRLMPLLRDMVHGGQVNRYL